MRSRKKILQKMKQFYEDIKNMRKMKKTIRLQVDDKFQQVEIKDLNDENNVEIFTSSVRDGKAFAAEKKIRELKSRTAKFPKNESHSYKNNNNFFRKYEQCTERKMQT